MCSFRSLKSSLCFCLHLHVYEYITLKGITTLGQSGPGSDKSKGLLHISPNSSSGASLSNCLISYQGHCLRVWGSYSAAEMQSVYSTASTKWASERSSSTTFSRSLLQISWKMISLSLSLCFILSLSVSVSVSLSLYIYIYYLKLFSSISQPSQLWRYHTPHVSLLMGKNLPH